MEQQCVFHRPDWVKCGGVIPTWVKSTIMKKYSKYKSIYMYIYFDIYFNDNWTAVFDYKAHVT